MAEDNNLQRVLLKKALGESLEPAEEADLEAWLQHPANREFYETQVETGKLLEVADQVLDLNEPRLDQKMYAAIAPKPQTKPVRKLRVWLAAASVILLLLTGALFYRNTDSIPAKPVAAVAIPPAANKARLRLANGSLVYLDSSRNGKIATQGAVSVTKSAGEIVYTAPTDNQVNHPTPGQAQPAMALNELIVPRGGQFQLQLPDGTHVWLNSSTDITYPVAFGTERRVKINGEAFFDVAKDASRPFVVETAQGTTRVLGTSFNVNAYTEDSVEMITVVSGAVSVSAAGKTIDLHPGDQAFERNALVSLEHPNLRAVTAWRRGFFYFQDADIHTIMRQFARFYDVTVHYEGEPTATTYDGLISRDLNLTAALALLNKMNIRATLADKTITVSPEGPQN